MLHSLTITNFQSHKKTVLEFHKGVNVIVGKSDSGKSSILRALGWVIRNKCDDASFLRRGAKSVSVSMQFDDTSVTRSRDSSGNMYELAFGGTAETFKAFKQEIPADIVDALNMTDINVSTQLEAPFLLSESSGEVAKTLNRLVDLSVIHESLSNIKKKVLQNNRDIENTVQQIEENKKELGTFKFLRSLEHKVKAYELLSKEKITIDTDIQDLSKAIAKCYLCQDKIEEYETASEDEEMVNTTLEAIESVRKSTKQIETLAILIEYVETYKEQCKETQVLIDVESKVNEAIVLATDRKDLTDSVRVIEIQTKAMRRLEEKSAELETEYIDSMPEECPLCGHAILEEA